MARHPDDAAARLVERVVSDAAFRAHFRRDPEAAAREAGLDPSAATAARPALETLELRESKSSLAGGLIAAAAEGIGLYELIDHGVLGAGVADAAVPQPPADALVVLHNKNIELDAAGIADLRAGRIDPRIVAVLDEVAKNHRITISAMMSDHGVRTVNGSVSNHHYGRAVDIAMVDGRPVSPGNEAARKLAAALLRLDPRIRPTELGSPWALGDPVAFTDGDHQDHIHVAFDDPMRPGQSLPPAAGGPAGSVPVEAPDDGDDPDQPGDTADVDDQDDGDGDADADDDDGDDDGDEEDDEDDDADEEQGGDGDDDDDDEDEDEPDEDEVGPDMEDLTDDEVVAGGAVPGEPEESALPDDSAAAGPELDLGDVASGYPGDGAPQEHVAAWMAAEAQRRGLPPELPVMASLVESGLRNLPGGDADSVGFFQMRTSIWDRDAYAGYGSRPHLQLDWFLDHAEEVRAQRIARGLPVRDPNHFGDWIADIERPAEQYRGRYQLRLDEARELLRGFHAKPGPGRNEARVMPVIRTDSP